MRALVILVLAMSSIMGGRAGGEMRDTAFGVRGSVAHTEFVGSGHCGVGDGYACRIPKRARCTEDMPCWDCRTMGNRVCGFPTTTEV